MNKSITRSVIISCLLLAGVACTEKPVSQETDARGSMGWDQAQNSELNKLISDSSNVYASFLEKKRQELPSSRIRNERSCVAVVPELTNTAVVVGASSGRGIVSCKEAGAESPWSQPMFFKMSSQSLGAQLGRQTSQVISYVVGADAGKSFISGETFKLGSELGATAGGTSGSASMSARSGNIYVMNQTGAFLGVSLSGSSIAPDADANRQYYGRDLSPNEILFGRQQMALSPQAQRFTNLLRGT